MSLKITLEFGNAQEAADFLTRAYALSPAAEVIATPAHEAAPAKPRGRPRKDAAPAAPAASEPTSEPVVGVAPAVPVEPATDVPAPEAAAPTTEDAKAALEAVFEKRGYQGAQQLIAAFGVSKLRDLDVAKYADFIAHAAKMAKGE